MTDATPCRCSECDPAICKCQQRAGSCCCGDTCTCGPDCPCDPACGCPGAKSGK